MKIFSFRSIIEPDDPNGYHGFVPILKGLHTCGDTIEEVKKNLEDAIRCHVAGLLKDGLEVPKEQETMEIIQTFSEKDLCFPRTYAKNSGR